jgi:hypothetical protein
MMRNILRSMTPTQELEVWQFETLLNNKVNSNAQENPSSKFLANVGFVCDKVPITAIIFQGED